MSGIRERQFGERLTACRVDHAVEAVALATGVCVCRSRKALECQERSASISEEQKPSGGKRRRARGDFFLIDLPTFAQVCELRADDPAAYLVLAAGTGADNRTSTWSREAIHQRTALSWRKARIVIDRLEERGLVRWLKGKGTRKPLIELRRVEIRPKLTEAQDDVVEMIILGKQPTTPNEIEHAHEAETSGWLKRADGVWSYIADRPDVKAWMPNALVGDETGKPTCGSTIVERLRRTRDPGAFRLLAYFYALQDLAEHGGVNPFVYLKKFDRQLVKTSGSLKVWQFSNGREACRMSVNDISRHCQIMMRDNVSLARNRYEFFNRCAMLEDAGALEWVYYLVEDSAPDASRIYPVAVVRHGKIVWEEIESMIGCYALRAALSLTREGADKDELCSYAEIYESHMAQTLFVPADRLAAKATLVGVPRLRCRARTTNATRWRKELHETAAEFVTVFRGIIAENAPELLAEPDRRYADFNDEFNASSTSASTEKSTLLQRDINDSSKSGKQRPATNAAGGCG